MNNPKIIFFDIDDTLLAKGATSIVSSTQQALVKLREKGIITAIATGRSPAVLPQVIKDFIEEMDIEMLVSINGQYVRYQNRPLVGFTMNDATIAPISRHLDQLNIPYALVSEHELRISQENQALVQALRELGIPYQLISQAQQPIDVYQMLAFYPQEYEAEVQRGLPNNVKTVRWHENGADILDKHGSKARGIQAALNQLGLTMADAMAFGDGMNDIEMMQAVGFGVAMGNAVDELKAIADYVCPSIDEDGIWRALVDLGVIDAV